MADDDRRGTFDGLRALRDKLREVAAVRDEYAGIPMPLEGERLVIEPTYSFAAGLVGMRGADTDEVADGWSLRSTFWSSAKSSDVAIFEHVDGRIKAGLIPGIHHITQDLRTLGCSDAWGIEQEQKAIELAQRHLKPRQLKHYLMTGMFLESSPRSGVTYVFRRLKPTVALAAGKDGEMRILASLCMHPIAYYEGSWAGAMCPTDDVIAHLMMMRADEPMFWRRSNQHAPHRPEAGL